MLKTKESSGNIIIYMMGKLDVHTSSDVEMELDDFRLNNPDKNLILDMSQVDHMSSSGLRILVSLMRELEVAGRKLKLCKLSKAVERVFEVVELMDMFDIYNNEMAAVKEKH